MIQNSVTVYGVIEVTPGTYDIRPITSDDELAEIDLTNSFSLPLYTSNQINSWNWEIYLSEVDMLLNGTFFMDASLFDGGDPASWQQLDNVTVTDGGFVDPESPVADDITYLGIWGPGNFPSLRVRWTGSGASSATAKIKVIVSLI